MLIALTGLHGAGKTYFANNVPHKFGFEVFNKKEIVEKIYKTEYHDGNWKEWYYKEFNRNVYEITKKIIKKLPLEKNIVLDAIHNNIEWQTITEIVPRAVLAVITTPEQIRIHRRDTGDDKKDIKRIEYWHSKNGEESNCLLAHVSWSFNGAASILANEQSFNELVELMKKSENNKKNVYDNLCPKDKELLRLMYEDRVIIEKLEYAKKLFIKQNGIKKSVNIKGEDYDR